ncbi:unnamed protein product [Urochloa humidicola]
MEIEGSAGICTRYKLPKAWIQFTGLPDELREFEVLWAVGSILGITKDVDMVFTRRHDISRIKVMVLDPNLIPHSVDVVIGDFLYELQFRVENEGDNLNPEPMDMDGGETGDGHGQGDDGEGKGPKPQCKSGEETKEKGKGATQGSTSASDGDGTQRPLYHLTVPEALLEAAQNKETEEFHMAEQDGLQGVHQLHGGGVGQVDGLTTEEIEDMENEDLLDDDEPENTSDDDFASKVAKLAGIPEVALEASPRTSKRRAATSADDSLHRANSLKAAKNLDGIKEAHTGFGSGAKCSGVRRTRSQ